MRRLVLNGCFGCALAVVFLASGYMLAVASFREEVWVDYYSGAIRRSCSVFPFSISREHSGNSFRVLFGSESDANAQWMLVERRHLLRFLDEEVVTEGQALVQAQNLLVASLLRNPVVRKETHALSSAFYKELRAGGVEAAYEYAGKLWLNLSAERPQFLDDHKP